MYGTVSEYLPSYHSKGFPRLKRREEGIVKRHAAKRGTVPVLGAITLALLMAVPARSAPPPPSAAPPVIMSYATNEALNRVILPAQTPSFVGGQTPPLEVTPGNRFMKILVSHVALWEKADTGLAISSDQRKRFREILEKTRGEIIQSDALDLRLVQDFEAMLVERHLPAKELAALNARIGEVEGKEGMQFVTALKELQAVLSGPQIMTLKRLNEAALPTPDISITPAFMFADRMLSIRWQEAMKPPTSRNVRESLSLRYQKARKWLYSLAAEKTVSDRRVADLLASPFVDMEAFGELEKTAGPLEGKFWGTFLRVATLLSPPAR